MNYIMDMSKSSYECVMHAIKMIKNSGFDFTHSTYGTPHFYNSKDKQSIAILNSICDGSIYFS